jgi:hypothetical protein
VRFNANMMCFMYRKRHTLEARRAEAMPVRASRKEATCPSRIAASCLSFCLKAWSWMRGSTLLSSMHAQGDAPQVSKRDAASLCCWGDCFQSNVRMLLELNAPLLGETDLLCSTTAAIVDQLRASPNPLCQRLGQNV